MLIPDALHALDRAGLLDIVTAFSARFSTVAAYSPRRHVVEVPGTFCTLRRRVLDHLIVDGAARAGARFCHGRVVSLSINADADVTARMVSPEHSDIRARYVVVATGASASLLGGIQQMVLAQPSGAALRTYLRSDLGVDRLVVSLDRSVVPGYGWIFPLGSGLYNVGCGLFRAPSVRPMGQLRQLFDAFMSEFPLARALLSRGELLDTPRGAPLRSGLTGNPHPARRVVAVGECIGSTFPFTGEGIGKAMETAEIAAGVVGRALTTDSSEVLTPLPALLSDSLRGRYRGYELAERWLGRPWFLDLVALVGARSRRVRRALTGVIEETTDLESIFNWKRLNSRDGAFRTASHPHYRRETS